MPYVSIKPVIESILKSDNRLVACVCLFFLGLVSGVLYLNVARMNILFDQLERFAYLFFIIFVIYLLAVLLALTTNLHLRWSFFIIIFFAIVFRLILLPSWPGLSSDIFRYIWDGRVQAAGLNPYLYPPNAPQLSFLRDAVIHPRIDFRNLPTIYPPASQLMFVLAYKLKANSFVAIKALIIFLDIITIFFITRILVIMKKSPIYSIIYAWNPLVIIEFANSGHIDVLAVLFLVAAILAFLAKREGTSGVFLGLATLAKFYPALLLPIFLKKGSYRIPLLFSATVLLGYIPFLGAGTKVLGSLGIYLQDWQFNAGIWYFLSTGLKLSGTASEKIALFIYFSIFLSIILVIVLRAEKLDQGFPFKSYLIIGLYILMARCLHPWYIIWIIPFLCLWPSPGWILFSGLIMLSYFFYKTDSGFLVKSLRYVEFFPLYFLLVSEILIPKLKQLKSKRISLLKFGQYQITGMECDGYR